MKEHFGLREAFHGYPLIQFLIKARIYRLSMMPLTLCQCRCIFGGVVSSGAAFRASGNFWGFQSKQNSKPKKQDCMQTYILLMIDNSVIQINSIPAYFQLTNIISKVIIMNKIHYIYKYYKLKYGIFIDSLLTTTHNVQRPSYKYASCEHKFMEVVYRTRRPQQYRGRNFKWDHSLIFTLLGRFL